MSHCDDKVWQSPELANRYLSAVRGAIPAADLQIDVMMRLLRELGSPVETFLDLGCGDGLLGAEILRQYPDAEGVFVDHSPAMIEAADERLANNARTHLLDIDYGQPNWTERLALYTPFNAIVSGFSIHHQADEAKRRLYADVYAMLTPGGCFINIEHVLPTSILGQKLFEEHFIDNLYERELRGRAPRSREQIRDEFLHRDDGLANRLAPIDLQIEWLRDIGYRDADCYFKLYELAVLAGRRPG